MLMTNNTPSDRVEFYQANFEHASGETNMQVSRGRWSHSDGPQLAYFVWKITIEIY
jgi:hypothetical protein